MCPFCEKMRNFPSKKENSRNFFFYNRMQKKFEERQAVQHKYGLWGRTGQYGK